MTESEAPAATTVSNQQPRDPLREFRESAFYGRLKSAPERYPWLWPYGALGALIFLATFNIWFATGSLLFSGDILLIHYPWFEFWRDEIGAGRFPWWNPYTFSGFPAFATPQSGYAYPPHWLATWMPSAMAINWMVGLHLILAAASTAWCAGKLGANRDGQFLAGVAFALGSALTSRMVAGHLSFIEALAWLPLATGLVVSINERHRPWQLALTMGMMTLAGQPDVVIFAAWWLPIWAFGMHIRHGRRELVSALGRAAAGMVLGVGLAAFFILPLLELQSISNRSLGFSWDFRTGGSLPLWHLLGAVNPGVFGDPLDNTYWPGPAFEWHERLLYVGVLALAVAFFARGHVAKVCMVAVVAALALAFGRYVPWYTLTSDLPGYEFLRVPGRHAGLASLALALAAGVGLQRLPGRTFALAALGGAVVLFVLSVSSSLWLEPFVNLLGGTDYAVIQDVDLGEFSDEAQTPLVVAAVFLAIAAMLALLPRYWFRRGLLLVAVLEIVFVLQPYRLESVRPEVIYASFDELPEGRGRALVNGGPLVANYGPVLKSVQPGGYTSLFSLEYQQLVAGQQNAGVAMEATSDDSSFLYLLGYESILDTSANSVSVFEPKPDRFWVSQCVRPGAAAEARRAGFPLFNCVTIEDAIGSDPETPRLPASLVSEHPGYLKVMAAGPGHLFTGTPLYPGWSAEIDGKSAPVEALDGAILGVELPEGQHEVVFRYRPAGLTLGLLISALSAMAVVAFLLWERRAAKISKTSNGVVADEADGDGEQEPPHDDLRQPAPAQ